MKVKSPSSGLFLCLFGNVWLFVRYRIMAKRILITGGTGTVGMHLSKLLKDAGDEVVHLSRNPSKKDEYPTYKWDIKKGFIDEKAFAGVTHIVHLAGAGVADERWTDERKKVILDSRVSSAKLLHDYVKKLDLKLESYISAFRHRNLWKHRQSCGGRRKRKREWFFGGCGGGVGSQCRHFF